jgi:hypothetical protein
MDKRTYLNGLTRYDVKALDTPNPKCARCYGYMRAPALPARQPIGGASLM